MDYSSWPVKDVSVNRLRLDPENPRLATSIGRPTQQELIADLLRHEGVLQLAREIARQGYFPNELLVATVEDAKTIVLEGNRRLAALKLLLNADLAPDEFRKRLHQLAERQQQKVERIKVIIAPSRDAAVPLIVARHKGESVKAWTTIMQARFIQSRLDHGSTIDDVVQDTGLEKQDIIKAVRDAKLYDVIRSLELPDNVQQVVSDPRQFPFTTLSRLIEFSAVQGALGVQIDAKHGFVTSLPAESFQKLLTKIVTDISAGDVTSRSHNTAEDVSKYARDLQRDLGKVKPTKTKTPAGDLVDPSRIQPPAASKKAKATKRQQPPPGLIPKGFRVEIQDDRIEAIVDELRRLRLKQFPNAVAVTFRSLLDMAVTRYLHNSGDLKKISAKQSQKQQRPPDWLPTLHMQLTYILQTPSIPLGPEGRKALSKFISDSKQPLTLDCLNWYTHVRSIPPTPEQLRSFWTMLFQLMELTLHKQV